MFRQKSVKNLMWARALFMALAAFVVLFAGAVWSFGQLAQKASAATSTTVNFQARLQTASGSIVPDGFYNVEFKLYDASSGGTALWTETRTGGDTVRVVNGYLTVNLGSVTPFDGSINWDQELWLTMNVGGTGTPTWDGEMDPRLKLTAIPYAFRAGQLALQTGSNTSTLGWATQTTANSILLPDANGTVCLQSSSTCGFVSGTAADFIQNQNAAQQTSSNFWISGTGRADTALQAPGFDTAAAGTLQIGATNATAINLNQNTTLSTDADLTLQGSGARISNAMGQTNAQGFGQVTTLSNQAVAFGDNTIACPQSVAIGYNADTRGGGADCGSDSYGIGIGWGVNTNGGSVAIGSLETGSGRVTGAGSGGITIGNGAQGAGDSIAIGRNADTEGDAVAIGSGATAATGGVAIGDASTLSSTSTNGIAIGFGSSIGANATSSIVLGRSAAASGAGQSNHLVVGGNTASGGYINQGYFGSGVTDAAPQNFTLHGTGGDGTDIQGATLGIAGGQGTGNANGGNINLQVSTPGASGSTLNPLSTVGTFSGANGSFMLQNSVDSTNAFRVLNQGGTVTALNVDTQNTRVGIGTAAPERSLDLVVDNSTTNAPPFRILQEGTGDTSFELQDTNGKSFFVGMDASDGGTFKIASSISAASSFTVGTTSVGGSTTGAGWSNYVFAQQVTTGGTGGTVSSISVYIDTVDGGAPGMKVALYADNSGAPGTKLAGSETSTTLVTGWNAIPISASVDPSTTYWLAMNFEGNGTDIRWSFTGGSGPNSAYWSKSFGSTWTDSPTLDNTDSSSNYSFYMTIVPGGTVDSFEGTNLLELSDTGAITFRNSTDSSSAFRILNGSDTALFQIDTSNDRVYVGNPTADSTGALLVLDTKNTSGDPTGVDGAMYYSSDTGKIRCYEGGTWKDCVSDASVPDSVIVLTPEYSGAVLNGTGVGTLTADFCANEFGVLVINTDLCASGESRSYYRWTSPQVSEQTYSIYVSYKLPETFEAFVNSSTVRLTAMTDDIANGIVDYEVFRSTGSAVTSCGNQTTVTTPSASVWYQAPLDGDETQCGFEAGDRIIFKINVRASNNASVYVENLDFAFTNN